MIVCKRVAYLPLRQLGKHGGGLLEIMRCIKQLNNHSHGNACITDARIAAAHAGCFSDNRLFIHRRTSLRSIGVNPTLYTEIVRVIAKAVKRNRNR